MRTLSLLFYVASAYMAFSLSLSQAYADSHADDLTATPGEASFNRTTLVVRDMDASMTFWRDVMNFEVRNEPRTLPPQENKYLGWKESSTEVAFARLLSHDGAGVGLLEIKDDEFPSLNTQETPAAYGGVVLVFIAKDIESVYERALKAGAVFKPLSLSPTGLSQQMYLRSPGGYILELFELLPRE